MGRWWMVVMVAAVACGRAPADDAHGSCAAIDDALEPVREGQAASTMAAYACMAWVGCACDELGDTTVPSCRHAWNMAYEHQQTSAELLGLTYDGGCLAQHVADLGALGCDDAPEATDWSVTGAGRCAVWHGERGLGEACTRTAGGWSDCAQGLACWGGECSDPCAVEEPPGERCDDVFGFACPPHAVCDHSGECVERLPPVGLGDSCENANCVEGTWCRQLCPSEDCTYTCVAGREHGVSCNADVECLSGFCSMGACATGPVTGEPCVERCLDGRECIDGMCGPPEAAICE